MREAPFWFDHIMVAIFTLGMGVNAWLKIQKFLDQAESGVAGVRARQYLQTIIMQWVIVTAACLGWVLLARRPLDALGLGIAFDGYFWSGVLLTVLLLGFFAMQVRAVRRSPEFQQTVRQQLHDFRLIMPQTPGEFQLFVGVSITAGICEEILYRGYLLDYLANWLPLPLAASLAVVAFGLAHSYQSKITHGPSGLTKTTIFGAVAMFLYWLTGSLWCPIVLHIAVDLQSGYLAYFVAANPVPQELDEERPAEGSQVSATHEIDS